MITAPLSPECIVMVACPDERCMYCWYLLHPTDPYPADWSSTCCAEHRAWMWAVYQTTKRGNHEV